MEKKPEINKLKTPQSRRCPSVGREIFGKSQRYHKKGVEKFSALTIPKKNVEGTFWSLSEFFLSKIFCPPKNFLRGAP